MPSKIVVGCQWGDEGKGKIVDMLAENSDTIVRYQGGANAGHTVINNRGKFILHLLPSGILRPDKRCILASGMVIDPEQLIAEISEVESLGLTVTGRLFISGRANIVFPYHKYLDGFTEDLRRGRSLGTTRRGIGPAYSDRTARTGLRMYDLLDEKVFSERLGQVLELKKGCLNGARDHEAFDYHSNYDFGMKWRRDLTEYITDTRGIIERALTSGESVLFEGAQGTLLDVDFGTYPYTTSSNTVTGALYTGCGIAPFIPDEVIGVVKAYTTRVGEGPFPTEIAGGIGDMLRENGAEFGASTGRPRRCGWLDLAALKYSIKINGINSIALTKADVLDGFEKVNACVAYEYNGQTFDSFPDNQALIPFCKPVYRQLEGWAESISDIKRFRDLPLNLQKYIDFIERQLGTEIKYISTGPNRDQTICR